MSLLLLLACARPDGIVVVASEDVAPIAEAFVATIPFEGLAVEVDADPERAARRGKGVRVALVPDGECDECYVVEGEGDAWVVRGGAPLGLQYGLAALMEGYGFRFHHPYDTRVPAALDAVGDFPREGAPDVARRGIHLHTLHPIEALWDVWEPGEENLARAERVVDWAVKNRADHLQWVALDDIQEDDDTLAAWREHTREVVDAAHARGLTTGLGIQLFGSGNLQLAWDLVDEAGDEASQEAQMDERLDGLRDLGFDTLDLSFGEFSGEDPERFVASVDQAYARIQEALPGVEVDATIHVGNYEDLRVEYQGEELQYYFLVDYADPAIVPWVHSVMFYDLFEDAGQAYHHDEFDEHRDYLLDRVGNGEPVGYFPETAYWVAFDNPVPVYMPLYMRSRAVDLDGIRAVGTLPQHVLFSTGWEWGYWQNDVASLRMSYDPALGWEDAVRGMYAPWAGGDGLASAIVALAEAQHAALLEARLVAYLAGRDAFIDMGDNLDIHSQPDRVELAEVAGLAEADRAAFAEAVVGGLSAHASDVRATLEAARSSGADAADPWVAEVLDGMEVSALRTEFAAAAWGAAVTAAEGGDPTAEVAAADAAMEAARAVVARRRASFHDPEGERLVAIEENPTLYDYGYLLRADQLCFWERERVQLGNVLEGTSEEVPGCALE